MLRFFFVFFLFLFFVFYVFLFHYFIINRLSQSRITLISVLWAIVQMFFIYTREMERFSIINS